MAYRVICGVVVGVILLALTGCGQTSTDPSVPGMASEIVLSVVDPPLQVTLRQGTETTSLTPTEPIRIHVNAQRVLRVDLLRRDSQPWRLLANDNPVVLTPISGNSPPAVHVAEYFRAVRGGSAKLTIGQPCTVPACAAAGLVVIVVVA